MSGRDFASELAVALLFSVGGAIAWRLLPWRDPLALLRAILTVLSSIYALWLLARAPRRAGRITAGAIALLLLSGSWLFVNSLPFFLLLQLGAIWGVRALCLYRSLSGALVDAGLCAVSLLLSTWALNMTGSVFAALWCFFLLQASHTLLPEACAKRRQDQCNEPFERASRTAETALQRLADSH